MGNSQKWIFGWLFAVLAVTANAAKETEKAMPIQFSGSTEMGLNYSWLGGSSDSLNFNVDYFNFNTRVNVSDKTKVVFNNAFSARSRQAATFNNYGQANFMSPFRITGGSFMMANQGAYIDHKCAEGWHTWIGNFAVPFGMESMVDRFDMPTYYFSYVGAMLQRGGSALGNGGTDLGIKVALTDYIPGTLEVALLEGSPVAMGSLALRWSTDVKSGSDTMWTPVISTYLGSWRGGPKDLGVSAGVGMKMGSLWGNLEWLYSMKNTNIDADPQLQSMSLYVEPGFDAGFANLSVKAEMVNANASAGAATNTDFNLGIGLSKTYQGGYRVKLAYAHTGLTGKMGYTPGGASHVNDVRLLFGTKF